MIGRIYNPALRDFLLSRILRNFSLRHCISGGFWRHRTIDSGLEGSIAEPWPSMPACWHCLPCSTASWLGLGLSNVWTRIVPPAAERSTYVLFSSLALLLLFWQWRPIGGLVWQVDNELGQHGDLLGVCRRVDAVAVATFLINHFDLFGLRQVYLHFRGQRIHRPAVPHAGSLSVVRHPIYFSWLCIFWATPRMTIAHLVFAFATTAYILIAIQLEERDLNRGLRGGLSQI